MKNLLSLAAMGALVASATTFANGWECVEKQDGLHAVTVYNQKAAPKTPGSLTVYHGNNREVWAGNTRTDSTRIAVATVEAGEFQENQKNIPKNKQYTAATPKDFEHKRKEVTSVVLLVNGSQDAETLAAGQLRTGRLLFKNGDKVVDKYTLACAYYLKGAKTDLDSEDDIKQQQQHVQQQVKQGKIDQVQQQK